MHGWTPLLLLCFSHQTLISPLSNHLVQHDPISTVFNCNTHHLQSEHNLPVILQHVCGKRNFCCCHSAPSGCVHCCSLFCSPSGCWCRLQLVLKSSGKSPSPLLHGSFTVATTRPNETSDICRCPQQYSNGPECLYPWCNT